MALTAMLSFVLVSLLHLVGNGFEFERWLKGLKYLIHDARHASYLLQIERYGAPYCERDCSPALVFPVLGFLYFRFRSPGILSR